jgi:tRNA1(Val) A37 N6-methylase TrmN6
VTIIHRADAMNGLLENLRGFGAIEVIAIHPRAGEAASRILLRAIKGRKTPLRILPPIILHETGGEWTEAAQSILREGRAIPRI